ncbi:MAG: hypothetical protein WA140_11440 [Geobacteraceae bacterium]
MLRLCSDSSRSYPGRSVRIAVSHAIGRLETIRESLKTGSYKPLPVKRVEIPKVTGGTRPLGIPTVLDRLIQRIKVYAVRSEATA